MTKEMPKAYEPKNYEDKIYKIWEDSGFFNPDNLDLPKDAKPYTIVLPPPNITAKLHIGHASVLAIEDLFIRYHRMKGYRALWIPGTDHAAIATQSVVEKKIWKEEGKTRHDLGKKELLKRVWDYLKETQSIILCQTRKMGSSLDWSREAFTLDEPRKKAVEKMFIDMYRDGIIYQGERIVNWCPRCASTLADDELEYKEQKGKFYTFKYDKNFPFLIATTRPETKLGDSAVAVNPKDKRYKEFVGKTIEADFLGIPLKLKIIANYEVDPNFGTGALGVTPAHSMVDWKMAEENKLEKIKVINEQGKIKKGFNEFSGKIAEEAREMIVKKLKEQGLLEKEEEINNNISVCYRCGTAIEPLPSKQWFVSVDKKLKRLGGKSLKEKALEVAKTKEIEFIPERFTKRYTDWMENLRDWCVSRQIWFGHPIPAFYCQDCGEVVVDYKMPKNCPKCGGKNFKQDEDSLDTWFSSGMWTFSTLGWPTNFKDGKKAGDLARFHPTQMLETGYEIITLWVSRMIIMSLFALGEIPFEKVYLNGMVLDAHGKKMSKSKGNGIDPLEMIEKYGTDAARLSVLIGNTPGNDLRLGEEKIGGCRNFVNKLWNIARYIIMNYALDNNKSPLPPFKKGELTSADKWILDKFNNLVKQVNKDLDKYNFSQAGEMIRDFVWNDLADWYLEAAKFEKNKEKSVIMNYILENVLKLLHPFIPFVTEVIWKEMGHDDLLMVAKYSNLEEDNLLKKWVENSEKGAGAEFKLVKNVISSIRNARSENKVEPAKKIKAVIYAGKNKELIESQKELIKNMRTGISELEIKENSSINSAQGKVKEAIYIPLGDVEIYLLGGVDNEKEKIRLEKEKANLEKYIFGLKKKLENQEFLKNAPEKIVAAEKEKLSKAEEELKKLNKK